jgi:copper homeostasis protein CutC
MAGGTLENRFVINVRGVRIARANDAGRVEPCAASAACGRAPSDARYPDAASDTSHPNSGVAITAPRIDVSQRASGM